VGAANVVRFESELIVLRNDTAKIRKAKDQVESGQQNERTDKRYCNPIRFRGRRAPSKPHYKRSNRKAAGRRGC
jgi:hypothetical protein